MRAFAVLVVAGLVTSCSHGAARGPLPERREGGPPTVQVEYQKPKDPAHEPLYVEMRDRRVLEEVAEAISVIRLPKMLTLRFAGCDGNSNAFYAEETASITFCYEYLADIERVATMVMNGEPPRDAVDGPVVFVLFHETAHAVFHLLKVPVLGKEEDAADSFAAYSLLRMGDEMALRMLKGAAWAYEQQAQTEMPELSDFSDVHSLDAQRYYNILCLAYGSDQKYFAAAVTSGKLPDERAESCVAELQQVRYAMQKLILPSVDARQLDRVLMKHGAKGLQTSAGRAP